MPADINARRYYRVAYQRLDDGTALLEISRPRAAIYLTGYTVECILKALLLVHTPAGERSELLSTFRGAVAHNIEWLRDRLVQRTGRLPVGANRQVSHRGGIDPRLGERKDVKLWPPSFTAMPMPRCKH